MFLALFFCQLASNTILAGRAFADGKKVEKDIDGDGKIDQIVFFDVKGKIERLEIDSNKDGFMDRFQYYRSETLVRIERDTDLNQRIDCRDFFTHSQTRSMNFSLPRSVRDIPFLARFFSTAFWVAIPA